MTLNGLEKTIEEGVAKCYRVRKRGVYVGTTKDSQGKLMPLFLTPGLFVVRFADDFVILARSKRMIEEGVLPNLKAFLKERGL
jgi:hypothetical protein